MKMQSIYKKLGLFVLAFVMVLTLGVAAMPAQTVTMQKNDQIVKAVSPAQSSTAVSVKANNREGSEITPITASGDPIESIQCAALPWATTKEFVISYVGGDGEAVKDTDGTGYTWEIKVQHLKQYRTATEFNISANDEYVIDSGKETDSGLLAQKIMATYQIDQNKQDERDKTNTCHGWGIYRFVISVGQKEYGSMFYYIEPAEITENVEIKVEPNLESTTGLKNGFICTVTNLPYCDENRLVWYVKGRGTDGKNYCLAEEDLNLSTDFPRNENWEPLNSESGSYTRVGKEFLFEANQFGVSGEIPGEWRIYCVAYNSPYEAAKVGQAGFNELHRSSEELVKTGNNVSSTLVIWLIVAGGVVLLGLIILIIVRSVKKEKVW